VNFNELQLYITTSLFITATQIKYMNISRIMSLFTFIYKMSNLQADTYTIQTKIKIYKINLKIEYIY